MRMKCLTIAVINITISVAFGQTATKTFRMAGKEYQSVNRTFCDDSNPLKANCAEVPVMANRLWVVLKPGAVSPVFLPADRVRTISFAMAEGLVKNTARFTDNLSILSKLPGSQDPELLKTIEENFKDIVEVNLSTSDLKNLEDLKKRLELDPAVLSVEFETFPRLPRIEELSPKPVLSGKDGRKAAEPLLVQRNADPNDPLLPQQYMLEKIHANEFHRFGSWSMPQVKIFVTDSGYSPHPDLSEPRYFFNASTGSTNLEDMADDYGHSTHVMGIMSAIPNNGIGVAGIAPYAEIIPIKVTDETGSGPWETLANGYIAASFMCNYFRQQPGGENTACIVSTSLGGGGPVASIDAAIKVGQQQNMMFFAAAGNNGGKNNDSIKTYPASAAGVLEVGSTDGSDNMSSFSNYAKIHDLAWCPGSDIVSTINPKSYIGGLGGLNGTNYYGSLSGTSMATPCAAASAALILADHPKMTAKQLYNLLMRSGDFIKDDTGNPALLPFSHYGRLISVTSAHTYSDNVNSQAPSFTLSNLTHISAEVSLSGPAGLDDFDFYYSTNPFNESMLTSVSHVKAIAIGNPGSGTANFKLSGLLDSTAYYIAMTRNSVLGDISPLSSTLKLTTKPSKVKTAWNFATADGQPSFANWSRKHGSIDLATENKTGTLPSFLWHNYNACQIPNPCFTLWFGNAGGENNPPNYLTNTEIDQYVESDDVVVDGSAVVSARFDYWQEVAANDSVEFSVMQFDNKTGDATPVLVKEFTNQDNTLPGEAFRPVRLELPLFIGKFHLMVRFRSRTGGTAGGIGFAFKNPEVRIEQ